MNLDLTSEQKMLSDTAAKFFASESSFDKVKELEECEPGYDPVLWNKMAELGWFGMAFPEEYDGYGGQFIDLTLILEQMGRHAVPTPFFSTIIQCGLALLKGASEEQKKGLIRQIIEGKLIMALAQYEEDGSYYLTDIDMKAEAAGNDYILNGTKMFVMDANIAQKLIVLAKTNEVEYSLLLVDADSDGIIINKIPTIGKDNNCEVIFNSVKVPKENIIGRPGNGIEVLNEVNSKAAVAMSAQMLGGAKASIDMTVVYAKVRVQYGKPIATFQAIQHYLANMLVEYDTCHNYMYYVVNLIDEGKSFAVDAPALKACVNKAYKFISDRAVQIHGGIGTSREADVALFYRKAKAFEVMCGDSAYNFDRAIDNLINTNLADLLIIK